MAKTIRAVYVNGVLKPLEEPELREGEEVIVKIIARVSSTGGLRRFFGIIRDVDLEVLEEEYYEYLAERTSIPR